MGVAPIVMALNVTVTAVPAAAVPVCNVSTMLDAPLAAEFAVAPPLNVTLDGVTPTAKKPDGYVSVTVLVTASAPPAVGVKLNVAATPDLDTMRSVAAMAKETAATAPPIAPDAIEGEAIGSALVCTVTAPPAVGVLLMVKPVSVTVTAVLAASAVPPAVMTMDVAPGAAAVRVAPFDTAAEGVVLVAKKPDG